MTFERRLAIALDYLPFVKYYAKKIYLRIAYEFFKNKENSFFLLKPRIIVNGFFGYYDKPSINKSSTMMLYHSVPYGTLAKPDPINTIDIYSFDLKSNVKKKVAETAAYNWQQGSRLQWLSDDEFIYNDFDENKKKYISIVRSIKKDEIVKKFDWPVQDAHNKEYFISLNYRRLATLREDYGYWNLPCMTKDEINDIKNDGLWKINYATGEGRLLVTLESLIMNDYKKQFAKGDHYVNHIMISPNGEHVIFLHRYFLKKRRFDRLMCMDKDAKNVKVLADNKMISHCAWVNNNEVIGYLRGDNEKDGYYKINIETGSKSSLFEGKLDKYGDGHPSVKGSKLITDTYPDKSRMQYLILADLKSENVNIIAKLFHGFDYKDICRCDLHPRFSPDGKIVTVDTVFEGYRQIIVFDIPDIIN